MGTSLKIVGLKRLIKTFTDFLHSKNCKVVYINLTKPSQEYLDLFDYCLFGKADDVCIRLSKLVKGKQVTTDIRKHFKSTKSNLFNKVMLLLKSRIMKFG